MPPTEGTVRAAACTNVAECAKARSAEALEWYRGAGEYCPECGEALTPIQPLAQSADAPAAASAAIESPLPAPESPPKVADFARIALRPSGRDAADRKKRTGRATGAVTPMSRLWFAAGIVLAVIAAFFYSRRPVAATDGGPGDVVAVCAIPSAQQLAADLVRGYAEKSATSASRFRLANVSTCGVRFSASAETPDAVIARDGIVAIVNPLNPIPHVSEQQLRAIYHGSIRDWSQLGGTPGPIVPILTAADTDEAKALAASLLYGVAIDRSVRRSGSSADVTRAVTGADRTSRGAIGLVAFSQAVPAKVVPLAYLPPPSVLSIGTRRYPYTLAIAVQSGSARTNSAAQALIDYARSDDGAAIVAKSGLIPREGL